VERNRQVPGRSGRKKPGGCSGAARSARGRRVADERRCGLSARNEIAKCRCRTGGRVGTTRALGRASGAILSAHAAASQAIPTLANCWTRRSFRSRNGTGSGAGGQRERDQARRSAGPGAAVALRQRPSGDETRRKRAIGSGRSAGAIKSAAAAATAAHNGGAGAKPGAACREQVATVQRSCPRAGSRRLFWPGARPAGSGLAKAAGAPSEGPEPRVELAERRRSE
jgi:hypothetical protein